jgi:hypothetical protein
MLLFEGERGRCNRNAGGRWHRGASYNIWLTTAIGLRLYWLQSRLEVWYLVAQRQNNNDSSLCQRLAERGCEPCACTHALSFIKAHTSCSLATACTFNVQRTFGLPHPYPHPSSPLHSPFHSPLSAPFMLIHAHVCMCGLCSERGRGEVKEWWGGILTWNKQTQIWDLAVCSVAESWAGVRPKWQIWQLHSLSWFEVPLSCHWAKLD